ncbi:FtsX-like permease family protein [Flavitalea sp.]|nr:FtsX-like permease family protein [Flavitalea sp.]
MFRNYFSIFIRNVRRHKWFAFINLVGLTVGITVCLQVFIFINYEKGFDKLHSKNIYRVLELKQEKGEAVTRKVAQTASPVGPALKSEFPQVRNFTRIISADKIPLQSKGRAVVMATLYGADSTFFQVFDFPLVVGDIATALKQPNSIVVTQALSKSLFGSVNSLGRWIRHEGRDTTEYMVTGIMEDVSEQSHLQFDALYSMSTHVGLDTISDWEMDWLFTYVELAKDSRVSEFESRLPSFLDKHMARVPENGIALFLQPLHETHLNSGDITRDALNKKKFNGSYLPVLIAIALFVLALAIINYINLSTARSFTRAREVAVRKSIGAGRFQIVIQFLIETICFSFVAFIISFAIALLFTPLFSRVTNRNMDFNPLDQPILVPAFIGLTLFTGLLSGIFPAISLANLKPVNALKGKIFTTHRSQIRSILVVLQFAISTTLSMVTLHVIRQLNFISDYDMGFNKEAVIVLPVSYTEMQREQIMMRDMKMVPGVQDLTGSLRRLGNNNLDRNSIVFYSEQGNREISCTNLFVDFNYCAFYQIPILAGRDLSPAFANDRNRMSFVINESLAHRLMENASDSGSSYSNLIGKPIRYNFDDSMGTIVGVVRDFNFNSLHQKVEPACITYQNEYYFSDLSIRLDQTRKRKVIEGLQRVWKEFLPNQQFSYNYLDEQLENLYQSDKQISQYAVVFTALSLVVACLGIIGIAAFNIERRVKEIGVRKVFGATAHSILFLLSGDFLKLVLMGIVAAIPVSLLVINRWKQNFAYRADTAWWLFALCGIIVLCIAQLTISFQAIRAAAANPVKSLRAAE